LLSARRSGDGWFRANCPYCLETSGKEDRRQSLGIKPSIAFFSCFKCGARGRLPDDFEAVRIDLAPALPSAPEAMQPPEGYEPLWTADARSSLFLGRPVTYLAQRGVSEQAVREARIGATLSGKFSGRIIAPVLDLDGRTWLGYVGRDWTGRAELKYRYPLGMQRAKFLFNQAALYIETDEPALVVEGMFDALPYWPDAVACLGKPGDIHRRLLAEAARPLAICLDGDAHEEAWALSELLRLRGRRAGAVRLPPCMDPNTVSRDWLREEARRCVTY
jgi:hypothetical protein